MPGIIFFPVLYGLAPYKKYIVFFLLLNYSFTAVAAREWFKFPVLVNHFSDHRKQDKSIDLAWFLAMHYGVENGTDRDADEDSQLPFHSSEYAMALTFISLTPPAGVSIVCMDAGIGEPSFGMHRDDHLPGRFPGKIWQPPRCC